MRARAWAAAPPHEVDVDGQYVFLEAGPAPKGTLCNTAFKRFRLSPAVFTQLRSYTKPQGPDLDTVLAAATGTHTGSEDDGTAVTLDLDPAKAASTSDPAAARHRPDRETLKVTFAGTKYSSIQSLEFEGMSGQATTYARISYLQAGSGPYQPEPDCLLSGTGTVTSLAQITAALHS